MMSEQVARADLPVELRLSGYGLILREWTEDDLPAMTKLFDDPDVAYWTPLVAPFDMTAARNHLRRVRRGRLAGERIHLAITTDGREAKGEVLLSRTGWEPGTGSLGYAIGAGHRGQRLAVRAVEVMTHFAQTVAGLSKVFLEIEKENEASERVARAAGFRLTDAPPRVVEEKGRTLSLFVWVR
ncbi:GNAT family N-acetyltransferase [Sphaerisporangium fuscum]|uniref:GNAT family N-acetyltransferase n=1 Tax=Sphaerisporangium fuscum TaxID=2835868 RepID=UPI0020299479|nr:GNAT family N-acetyltransferase [Sphaerisporangium fuscum]